MLWPALANGLSEVGPVPWGSSLFCVGGENGVSSAITEKALLNSAIITAQKIIPQMNKVELKKIGGMAHEDTIKECNIPLRLLHIIIDLTAAKLQVKTDEKPQASKKKI